jgi:hypothetical protein
MTYGNGQDFLPECRTCLRWLFRIETNYDDGSQVVNWSNPEGLGKCTGPLRGALTEPDFGCNKYAPGGPISEVHHKEGAPWHYWKPGPCPECKHPLCGYPDCNNPACPGTEKCIGVGGRINANPTGEATMGTDNRCCGTGTVRYYDDGYVGENKTKRHPKELELGLRGDDPTPACPNCRKSIDNSWMACPFCGTRLKQDTNSERMAIGPAGGEVLRPIPEGQ